MGKIIGLISIVLGINVLWNALNYEAHREGSNGYIRTNFLTFPNKTILIIGNEKGQDLHINGLFLPYTSIKINGKEINGKTILFDVKKQEIFQYKELTNAQQVSYSLTLKYLQDEECEK